MEAGLYAASDYAVANNVYLQLVDAVYKQRGKSSMTDYVFKPSSVAPFQFQPMLDGIAFNASVTYNLFGDRYYINLYYQNSLVYSTPLIGSLPGMFQIQLLPQQNPVTGALWISTMTYTSSTSTITVLP